MEQGTERHTNRDISGAKEQRAALLLHEGVNTTAVNQAKYFLQKGQKLRWPYLRRDLLLHEGVNTTAVNKAKLLV